MVSNQRSISLDDLQKCFPDLYAEEIERVQKWLEQSIDKGLVVLESELPELVESIKRKRLATGTDIVLDSSPAELVEGAVGSSSNYNKNLIAYILSMLDKRHILTGDEKMIYPIKIDSRDFVTVCPNWKKPNVDNEPWRKAGKKGRQRLVRNLPKK